MKDIHPLFVSVIIFVVCLLGAYVTFGILESSGVVQDERIQLGGSAAGFIVMFIIFSRFYSLQMDKLKSQSNNLNMLIVLDPKSSQASEAKFVECSYEIMDSKGEILDKRDKIKITKDALTHNWKFFIPLPPEIKYEHLTTITLKDDKGIEYPMTDYILSHVLEIDRKES